MNAGQKQLISLLNYGLGFSKDVNIQEFLWDDIFNEAMEHSILSLIYYSINKLNLNNTIDKNLIDKWKRNVILTSLEDLSHNNELEIIIRNFNQKEIYTIVLKGIIIKELYPKAELRTMCDYDILVEENNLLEAMHIMEGLGYKLDGEGADEHGAHKAYVKKGFRKVELHWTLINDDYFTGTKEFEKEIWDNAENFMVGNSVAKKLNHENMILHLSTHMAVHIIYGGFGLRQLSDFALYIKTYENNINWGLIFNKGEETGIRQFIEGLLLCSKRLFNINIPYDLKYFELNDSVIDELIETIFESGVFGRKNKGLIFVREMVFSKDENINVVSKFINVLCPKAEEMGEKYNYAKKNKVLLPIAWGHHICSGIVRRDYSIKNKADFLTKTVKVANKRKKMYDDLNLS